MMQRMLRSVERKAQRTLPTAMVHGKRPLWTMDVKKFEAPVGFLDVRGFLNTRQVKHTPSNLLLSLEMWNTFHPPGLRRLGRNLVSANHAARELYTPPLPAGRTLPRLFFSPFSKWAEAWHPGTWAPRDTSPHVTPPGAGRWAGLELHCVITSRGRGGEILDYHGDGSRASGSGRRRRLGFSWAACWPRAPPNPHGPGTGLAWLGGPASGGESHGGGGRQLCPSLPSPQLQVTALPPSIAFLRVGTQRCQGAEEGLRGWGRSGMERPPLSPSPTAPLPDLHLELPALFPVLSGGETVFPSPTWNSSPFPTWNLVFTEFDTFSLSPLPESSVFRSVFRISLYSDLNGSSKKVREKDKAEVLLDEAGIPKEEDYTELRLLPVLTLKL